MVIGVMTMLYVVLLVFAVFRAGIISHRKMTTQSAADLAAYAGASVEANSVSMMAFMNRGMAFIFPTEDIQTFWMKDTPLFLDMVFINSQHKIVGIIHNAEPGTLDVRQIEVPSRYVIEVQGGFCKRYGVHKGGVVAFRNIPDKVKR